MTTVYAESCRHLSAGGLREGIEHVAPGTWRLADGCVVAAHVKAPDCPTCRGHASVLPDYTPQGYHAASDRDVDLLDGIGITCPATWCDGGLDARATTTSGKPCPWWPKAQAAWTPTAMQCACPPAARADEDHDEECTRCTCRAGYGHRLKEAPEAA
jgi:hypothetical protein